jgi:hypothetical protein
MLLGLKRISTALGLLAASASCAFAQAPNQNQATADAVARVLKGSPELSGYRIEIETQNGLVTLAGGVANETQKAKAASLAGRVAGVSGVVNKMKVVGDTRVRPAQYQPNAPQVAMGGHHNRGEMVSSPAMGGGQPVQNGVASGPSFDGGPLPEGAAGGPGATQGAGANMPNYSWPSYAPYPNYSAVGYPTAYPWQAWPNISAPYPYPEVPLDWRAVTLRWNDGIWWLDFKKNYTRPFFTPYPFGLFAY